MNKKICVTSYESVGCTFVDWSLHYLSGQTQYYNLQSGQWIPISQNPITNINAHGHDKNHPCGYSITNFFIEQFNLLPDAMYSMYPFKLRFDIATKLTKIPSDQLCNPEVFNQVVKFINDDYKKILQACHEQQVQVIYVHADPRMFLYHQNVRDLDKYLIKPGTPASEHDKRNEIQEIFFNNSVMQWKELNLTEVWDIRERMALDIRPNSVLTCDLDFQFPHHWVNCLDLWTRTENTIKNIMSYLNLEIVPACWQAWLPICKAWQEQQLSLLDFCYNQPHIVESIVNNWHYEIDLTFHQEVLIQHFLIYQYGLNLKTWQLEKFPSNTQDLHKLLEPNIHTVPKIY
jgi:hypothetical protein